MTRSTSTEGPGAGGGHPATPAGDGGPGAEATGGADQPGMAPAEALLCFNLYAASHAFIRLYAPHLDRLGITYPQFLVLLALHDRDGQGVGELGRALAMETNTLSPLLKRMQGAGLVQRARSARDERRVEIRLTEEGQLRAARAAEVPGCIARESDMDEAEYLRILDTLRGLRARIAQAAARLEAGPGPAPAGPAGDRPAGDGPGASPGGTGGAGGDQR